MDGLVDVINPNPPNEVVEHPERMCNDDVNDPIPEHENDDGTDHKSIQFACPEQVPPTTEEQPKRGRGGPRKTTIPPKILHDKQPQRGRGRPRKPKPPDIGDKPKCGRGRPPKHKDPPPSNRTKKKVQGGTQQ